MKFLLAFLLDVAAMGQTVSRPSAVPLVVHDLYFSIWSTTDKITDQPTRHWTGAEQPLSGIVRIDGKAHRFLGNWRRAAEPIAQTDFEVTARRSSYMFAAA